MPTWKWWAVAAGAAVLVYILLGKRTETAAPALPKQGVSVAGAGQPETVLQQQAAQVPLSTATITRAATGTRVQTLTASF